ncbi:MAG: hypothetical protein N2Z57_01925 [Oscillospiraceae bacterium]|nr:hypothetical protein [Oscillospiraceae bacterium]
MMPSNEFNWYKLDNAARLFPSVSTVTATNVFRLSCRLKEDISPALLQKAVEQALDETPSFKVRLRKGLFWYYFEQNPLPPVVEEEHFYPCRKIDKGTNNGYLFYVIYFGKYIHIEYFHALCDGTGAAAFLSKVVARYLLLAHPEELPGDLEIAASGVSHSAQTEDSFLRVARKNEVKAKNEIRKKAFNPASILTQNGEIKVIKGIMPLSQVKAFAKSKNATITEALAAVLIYSIYMESFRFEPSNRSIEVCVPVNLRKFFPSETMRNFFATIYAGANFYERELSFDEVLEKVKSDMAQELSAEKIYPKVMFYVGAQKNIALRFVPLFLKNLVLRISFAKGEQTQSTVLSNLGQFNVPKELEPYIERFEFLLSPTLQSRYKTSACSFGDVFVYCFTSNAENTDIQRRFFSILKENGVDVTISCNMRETLPESVKEKKKKEKKKRGEKNEVLQRMQA